MSCQNYETCKKIQQYLDSREMDIPITLSGELLMIAGCPALLIIAKQCIEANPNGCRLSLHSDAGMTSTLKPLLVPLQPTS